MSTEPTSPGAAERPRRRADELLATLADRIGARFSAATVYGTPIERDGVTVVPVAAVRFGVGAGGGSDPSKGQDGEWRRRWCHARRLHRAQGGWQPVRPGRPPPAHARAHLLHGARRTADHEARRGPPPGERSPLAVTPVAP